VVVGGVVVGGVVVGGVVVGGVVVVDVVDVDVVGPSSATNAAVGGVIFWVVPVCERNPFDAATNAVVEPAGRTGPPAPVCAGPGLLPASKPVSTQPFAATPAAPPNVRVSGKGVATSNCVALVTPMSAVPPAVPFVVKTLPVLSVLSINVMFPPRPTLALGVAPVVGVLIVAETPGDTAVIVVPAGIWLLPNGGETNMFTSPFWKLPISVVEPEVHETAVTCRPTVGSAVKFVL
jgi:hypothetical protein